MILKYMGHSFFTLTSERGTVVATDPYGDFYQYPKRRITADICTVSHHHNDHDGIACLTSTPQIIDTPGVHRTEAGVRITGIPTSHDHHGGGHRGTNTVFIIDMDGLRIAHAGDLGCPPDAALAREIGRLDVLLLPVGGHYTIDGAEALQTIQLLRPKMTVPMHYRTEYNPTMPIAPLDDFLKTVGMNPKTARSPLLRLTAEDMSERKSIITMSVADQ